MLVNQKSHGASRGSCGGRSIKRKSHGVWSARGFDLLQVNSLQADSEKERESADSGDFELQDTLSACKNHALLL
jgi:hypothetical protein